MKVAPEDAAKLPDLRTGRGPASRRNEGHARRRGEGLKDLADPRGHKAASMKATPEDVAKYAEAARALNQAEASMKATPEDVAKDGAPQSAALCLRASMKATPEDVAKL